MHELNTYLSNLRRDTKTEGKLMSELRKLTQDQRYSLLLPYFSESTIALLFAQKVSLKKMHYKQMWAIGLESANVSSIRFWLSALAPNLGWNKLIGLIDKEVESGNQKIGAAIYHVPYLFRDHIPSDNERDMFKLVVQKAWDSELLDFNPNIVWGSQWVA